MAHRLGKDYGRRLKLIKKYIPVLILLIPVFILFYPLFFRFFSFDSFKAIFNYRTLNILYYTFIQALISAIFSLLISICPVIYLYNKKSTVATLIESTFFIPFFFPVISTVTVFSFISRYLPINLQYSLFTVIIAHVFYNSPIYVMYLSQAVKKIPINRFESASLETTSNLKLLFHIVIPSISGALSRSFFLVFLFCFTSFGVLISLGNIRLSNFEIAIYQSINTNLNISQGLSFAIIQFVILLAINFIILRSKSENLEQQSIKKNNKYQHSIIGSALFIILEFSIVFFSVTNSFFYSITRKANYFVKLFSTEFNTIFPVIIALRNTFLTAIVTSIIVTITTYFIVRNGSRIYNIIINSFLCVSSSIISLSILTFHIYYSVPAFLILIIGYTVLAIPLSYSFMYSHIKGISKKILEAASVDGAGFLYSFINIEFPLLFPILLRNFIQIFALIFGEFTISYIFQSGANFPLISTVHYSITSRRYLGESYALNTICVMLILFSFALSIKFSNKAEKSSL